MERSRNRLAGRLLHRTLARLSPLGPVKRLIQAAPEDPVPAAGDAASGGGPGRQGSRAADGGHTGLQTYRAGVVVKQRTGGVLTSRSAPATKSSAAGRSVVVGPARDGSGP